ncbi:MAG: hypothetical protein M1608_10815 [Candidatus Omnitrophica bacterium]|nr:hypothetical protein [Candidatus Omnitrophota bacterium]
MQSRLQSIQLGKVQSYKNIAIVPLLAPADGKFKYCTLGEALNRRDVAITEVTDAGSVPELMVINRGKNPVLLVDGEELAGAKQNRVLNTSILLKEVSETKIPVSCTEQGRWSYASKTFSASGNVMAYRSRSRKTRAVQRSLEASAGHRSDQGEVWDGVAELQAKAGASSPTSAMSDVFKAREDDLRRCEETFKPVPNQVGLLAFINGAPAGADMVSLIAAYAKLHSKLVRSYALEALLDSKGESSPADTISARARQFLDEIAVAEASLFPSIGHGTDYRYNGKALAGAALVHENEVIHAAFFRLDDPEQPDKMASYHHRRRGFES